jgi:hypothetical protein
MIVDGLSLYWKSCARFHVVELHFFYFVVLCCEVLFAYRSCLGVPHLLFSVCCPILFFTVTLFENEFYRYYRSGQLGVYPSSYCTGHVSRLHGELFHYFETTSSQIEFGSEDVGAKKMGSTRGLG